jgi:hypothetical protein
LEVGTCCSKMAHVQLMESMAWWLKKSNNIIPVTFHSTTVRVRKQITSVIIYRCGGATWSSGWCWFMVRTSWVRDLGQVTFNYLVPWMRRDSLYLSVYASSSYKTNRY